MLEVCGAQGERVVVRVEARKSRAGVEKQLEFNPHVMFAIVDRRAPRQSCTKRDHAKAANTLGGLAGDGNAVWFRAMKVWPTKCSWFRLFLHRDYLFVRLLCMRRRRSMVA